MKRFTNTDCAHYRGSRPCTPHKQHGVVCGSCEYYRAVRERVGIVKLAAMGDVLRTTALLPAIRTKHPDAEISWITERQSLAIVSSAPGVDRVIAAPQAPVLLASVEFDVLYNLDNGDDGVGLTHALNAREKYGFRAGPSGRCEGVYEGGTSTLYELGVWDDLKRANTRSYLELLAESAGLRYSGARPAVNVDRTHAAHYAQCFAALPRPLIGINTDAGTRWTRKQWNLPYVESAVASFVARGYGVVLVGGEAVQTFNDELAARFDRAVYSTGTQRDVRELFAAIAQLDILLTGDTLAMHAAWGLNVPVVALFGPTSAPEIDLNEGDVKLAAADLACLGCYLHTCDVTPHCMDRLLPDSVVAAVEQRLLAARAAGPAAV